MKIFNFLKPKETPKTFSQNELDAWPSLPNDALEVPSLNLLKEKSLFSEEASKVLEWSAEVKAEGAEIEYQVVMKSQYGALTLPALIKRADGGFLVYYSHCSKWDDAAIGKLLDWVVKLRACDFVHSLRIEICDNLESLPVKVREIISKRTEHCMLLNMLPHLSNPDIELRARVFAEGFAYFFNDKKILNFDKESLGLVEEWFKKNMKSIPKDSFYFQISLNFLGSFYFRVLKEIFNGERGKGDFPDLEIPGSVKVRINPFKIMADFILNPRIENSLSKNLQLLSQEIKDRK